VQRLTQRVWRVAGARRHAYVVTDTPGHVAAIVDADTDDATQWQALRAAAPADVRWLVFLSPGAEQAGAALAARWPAAHALAASREALQLGTDTRLEPLSLGSTPGLHIVDDALLLRGDAEGPPAELVRAGVRWIAGGRGFLQRLRIG
jgi:hypothetical protein